MLVKVVSIIALIAVIVGVASGLQLLGAWIVGLTDIPPYGSLSFFIQLPFRLAGMAVFAGGVYLVSELAKEDWDDL